MRAVLLRAFPWALSLAILPALAHANGSQELLREVAAWDFQLQRLELDNLASSPADMLVIDYERAPEKGGVFTRTEIDRLRKRPGQRDRLVIAYLSVGEAEEYRFYWRREWRDARPDWLLEENCRWPSNHLVRFWDEAWKNKMYRGPNSYVARILAAGFDGVYLDRIDVFWDIRRQYPNAQTEMSAFVRELAAHARADRPEFIIIAQNAELLLSDPSYRSVIDAIAKEDLLHGLDGTGVRNKQDMIEWSTGQLRLLQSQQKPIFLVEYLRSQSAIRATRREVASLGFRPTFPTRALDGRDPTDPTIPRDDVGTPEFRAGNCR